PRDTWGSVNCASLAAITTSASATKCNPPPAHIPLTAAITGVHTSLCHAVKRSAASRVRRDCSRIASLSRPSAATSRPVWKLRPSPVFTITRTAGSSSSSCHASSSSVIMRASIALPTSGRAKISHPTGPRRSTTSRSYTSAPAEVGRPLLAERLEALPEVVAARRQLHPERLVTGVVAGGRGRAGVKQPLRQAQRDRRALRQRAAQLGHCGVELLGGNRLVDHPPLSGFGAVDDATEVDHLSRAHVADA